MTVADYIDKAELNRAVAESQAAGRITDELARMIVLMVYRYAGRVAPDCDREEIAQEVMLIFCRHFNKLDSQQNVFSYITSTIKNEVHQTFAKGQQFDKLRLKFWNSLRPSRTSGPATD